MKKKQVSNIFVFFCKVLVCVFIGSLWAPLVVPIMFYFFCRHGYEGADAMGLGRVQ